MVESPLTQKRWSWLAAVGFFGTGFAKGVAGAGERIRSAANAMRKLQKLRWLLLASVAGLGSSCGTLSPLDTSGGARFHDEATTDVVVRFYSWNSIQIVQPDIREGGFLPVLDRESVTRKLDETRIEPDLAVVVLGHMLSNAQQAEVIRSWNTIFAERGFRRVVLVREGFKNSIDGLLILHDSAMGAAHDEPRKFAATVAALPATAGANVAYSSGGPGW